VLRHIAGDFFPLPPGASAGERREDGEDDGEDEDGDHDEPDDDKAKEGDTTPELEDNDDG
jgi:hypothetical protein